MNIPLAELAEMERDPGWPVQYYTSSGIPNPSPLNGKLSRPPSIVIKYRQLPIRVKSKSENYLIVVVQRWDTKPKIANDGRRITWDVEEEDEMQSITFDIPDNFVFEGKSCFSGVREFLYRRLNAQQKNL